MYYVNCILIKKKKKLSRKDYMRFNFLLQETTSLVLSS